MNATEKLLTNNGPKWRRRRRWYSNDDEWFANFVFKSPIKTATAYAATIAMALAMHTNAVWVKHRSFQRTALQKALQNQPTLTVCMPWVGNWNRCDSCVHSIKWIREPSGCCKLCIGEFDSKCIYGFHDGASALFAIR